MNKNVYSVSQVNNYIKLLFEDDVFLNDIFIEGEISNFKKHTSGHIYFTIKDENASINSVIYKTNASSIDFNIENGMKITAFGYISSYIKTGQYQFYVKEIAPLGKGNLQKDFEALKQKLFNQGFFDEQHKKPIPKLPKNIAVITSSTGAAIQDIINIYKRRNQSINLILIPSVVQGKDAHLHIINAIEMANDYGKIDVLILARGGGAYEDLECFNSEELAKAIYFSEIPTITGIGHEIDFTIADFVSDFRAPTPSAAIEIALPEANFLQERLEQAYYKINKIIDDKIQEKRNKLDLNINTHSFKNFLDLVMNYQLFVENSINLIEKEFNYKVKEKRFLLENIINKLDAISPTNILKNGYAFISNEYGNNIKSSKNLKKNEIITINFYDGEKKAKIL